MKPKNRILRVLTTFLKVIFNFLLGIFIIVFYYNI